MQQFYTQNNSKFNLLIRIAMSIIGITIDINHISR